MSAVYYNEFDKFAAAWLRELMSDGLIPIGDVDERNIIDVKADDLDGYSQCHFFAGIGGWAYALDLAGWEGPVWTGSCPCQPLSSAGQRKGHVDERHLWPAFYALIAECLPATVFGEQVASKDGREWLSGVRADLEGVGYAIGAADLCAASVGAPHIRQRLWWVADSGDGGARGIQPHDGLHGGEAGATVRSPQDGRVADDKRGGRAAAVAATGTRERLPWNAITEDAGNGGGVGDPNDTRPQGQRRELDEFYDPEGWQNQERCSRQTGPSWISCADGKARRAEPGIFPLVDGFPNRVGTLRGAGNAIVPALAAEFVRAFMEGR